MNEYEFYITIAGVVSGMFALSLKLCLKSRCEDVNFLWGCFNVHRNVEVEQDIENHQQLNRTDSTTL